MNFISWLTSIDRVFRFQERMKLDRAVLRYDAMSLGIWLPVFPEKYWSHL